MVRILFLLLILTSQALAQELKQGMRHSHTVDGESPYSGQVKATGRFGLFEDGELYFTATGSSKRVGVANPEHALALLHVQGLQESIDLVSRCGLEVDATALLSGLTEGEGPSSPWQTTTLVSIIQYGPPRLVPCQPVPSLQADTAPAAPKSQAGSTRP
ncbi:MAG: hypothetical protein K0S46_1896 [Moraxellaceae bacterium]|nr:hypothetical protein [Moraxellaceae bacterium]